MSLIDESSIERNLAVDPAPRSKPKSSLGIWVFWLLVIIGGAVAYHMYTHSRAAAKEPVAPQPVSVGVTSVEKRDMPIAIGGFVIGFADAEIEMRYAALTLGGDGTGQKEFARA